MAEYSARSIKVLEGLDAVRKRPAMYIGSTGPQGLHHLVYEVVDNSVDEALAGYCNRIILTLHADGSCSVQDNGRGIPTGIHPTEKISAAEVVLTKLHAGGKFDKETYKFSGGLHGVGISVVNALSTWLEITIYQNGNVYFQRYERGKPTGPLHITGETTQRGTLVRFLPDPQVFTETTEFNFDVLSARMREFAFLNKGLHITVNDERTNKINDFFFEGGIVSFIESINAKKTPLFPEIIYFDRIEEKGGLELALQYNESFGEQLFSFVNNINTTEGGTHVAGFKAALTKACNKRAQEMNILKDNESFSSEDVREGLVCVLNMKVAEPQFEGQTKAKLGNSEVKGIVESWLFAFLDTYFEEHPSVARKILHKAQLALHAREAARKARELTRRKTILESSILPGKLADCSNENPSDIELFIVEGDSAGGSAKQGRDRFTQAILPLRGKILNVEKARLEKILSNEEIKALIAAVGCGISKEEFNPEKARYHKIILMTDADVDGAHIRTLLLTFFFRYMKPLVELGYLYIAQPPLYKIKIGKQEQYIKDDDHLKEFLIKWSETNTELITKDKKYNGPELAFILEQANNYAHDVEEVAHKFKLTIEQALLLIDFIQRNPQSSSLDASVLVQHLHAYAPHYEIEVVDPQLYSQALHKLLPHKSYIRFKKLNYDWFVSTDFFNSPEIKDVLVLDQSLNVLKEPWELKIIDKERSITGTSIMDFVLGIGKISKPYLSVQRYKGLGEMNADQLWETSMDPKKRILLQVSVGDALQADQWFDTLMGDDVQGRRSFIEDNGHFVKNLDV